MDFYDLKVLKKTKKHLIQHAFLSFRRLNCFFKVSLHICKYRAGISLPLAPLENIKLSYMHYRNTSHMTLNVPLDPRHSKIKQPLLKPHYRITPHIANKWSQILEVRPIRFFVTFWESTGSIS